MKENPSPLLEQVRRDAAAKRVPLHAVIETTHRCNLKCRHCYIADGGSTEELSTRQITQVLQQLAELQTMFLTLTGGEFFLRNDAWEILAAAREHGFVTVVLTNGTLIGEQQARQLAELSIFQIHVSLLGNEEVHNRIAGVDGALKKTVDAMDYLRNAGVKVVAKLILTKESISGWREMRDLALAHGDELIISTDLIPSLDGTEASADLLLSSHDLAAAGCSYEGGEIPERRPESSLCNAGQSLIAISPEGDVYPCISFRKAVGNVVETPLRELWLGPAMLEISGLCWQNLTDCENCADRPYCVYCPGRAWSEMNCMTAKTESLCKRANLRRELQGSDE